MKIKRGSWGYGWGRTEIFQLTQSYRDLPNQLVIKGTWGNCNILIPWPIPELLKHNLLRCGLGNAWHTSEIHHAISPAEEVMLPHT